MHAASSYAKLSRYWVKLLKFCSVAKCSSAEFSDSGSIDLARLQQLTIHTGIYQQGECHCVINTTLHERYGFPVLNCQLSATIKCICARCLSVYSHDIAADVRYVILSNSSYEQELSKSYEILMVEELSGDKINLHHLCEQELILRCPVFSSHSCSDIS